MSEVSFERVEVEWLDSVSDGSWMPLEQALHEAEAEPLHYSCGYLLAEVPDYVLLALSYQDSAAGKPMVADTMRIPRPAIRAVHRVRLAKGPE